ncbi:geranylgeranylglyceryl/heptaprenylglyceryl phosphate synthase, partial [Halobacteriota archaeon]
MKVEKHLNEIIEKDGVAHLTLIDPDSQTVDKSAEIAADATAGGTDAIMIGGSVGAGGSQLD